MKAIAQERDTLEPANTSEAARKKLIREREKLTDEIRKTLQSFADKIASIKVSDPACGSGNFLYVALRLLLDLQNEVISFSDEMGAGRFYLGDARPTLRHRNQRIRHELAQMTIQIGYIQWLRDNGYGFPSEPILRQTKNIMNMDSILAYDENGKPVEPEWTEVDVIIGNPPFLGDRKMRQELGEKYINDLRLVYKGRVVGVVDLVCYWFEKARAMIEDGKVKRVGLLATTTIRNGASRKILERIKSSSTPAPGYPPVPAPISTPSASCGSTVGEVGCRRLRPLIMER